MGSITQHIPAGLHLGEIIKEGVELDQVLPALTLYDNEERPRSPHLDLDEAEAGAFRHPERVYINIKAHAVDDLVYRGLIDQLLAFVGAAVDTGAPGAVDRRVSL